MRYIVIGRRYISDFRVQFLIQFASRQNEFRHIIIIFKYIVQREIYYILI